VAPSVRCEWRLNFASNSVTFNTNSITGYGKLQIGGAFFGNGYGLSTPGANATRVPISPRSKTACLAPAPWW